jgi:hypothetical protein
MGTAAVCNCLDCGEVYERESSDQTYTEVEHVEVFYVNLTDEEYEVRSTLEGVFDQCPFCRSLDVDVFSPEGWKMEEAFRALREHQL